MICTGMAGAQVSVTFQPAASPPIQQVDATSFGTDSGMLISAGGLESGALYQASGQTIEFVQAEIHDGIVSMRIQGTQQFPGEPVVRRMTLDATCPLFPAETGG